MIVYGPFVPLFITFISPPAARCTAYTQVEGFAFARAKVGARGGCLKSAGKQVLFLRDALENAPEFRSY